MNPFALTLLIAFSALGCVIATDLIRNNTNPLHDPSDDDAELDDLHVASVARRGRGFASFHASEIADG